MSDRDPRERESKDGTIVDEIELDTDQAADLEEAMSAALESVEGRESDRPGTPAEGEDARRWQEEAAESKEKWLRAMADLDNYRKRTQRERADAQRYEGFHLLQQFLGVVDNLELALQAGGGIEDLKTGLELILRQMKGMLADAGVEAVAAAGAPFDPNIHDAVSREEGGDIDGPTVVQELQPGYTMKDRLLRPARVVVAVPDAAGSNANSEGE